MRSHGQVFRWRLEKCDAEFRERVGTGGAKGTHHTARPLFLRKQPWCQGWVQGLLLAGGWGRTKGAPWLLPARPGPCPLPPQGWGPLGYCWHLSCPAPWLLCACGADGIRFTQSFTLKKNVFKELFTITTRPGRRAEVEVASAERRSPGRPRARAGAMPEGCVGRSCLTSWRGRSCS